MGNGYSRYYVNNRLIYAATILDDIHRFNFSVDYSKITQDCLRWRKQFLELPLENLTEEDRKLLLSCVEDITKTCRYIGGLETHNDIIFEAHEKARKALYKVSRRMLTYLV